MHAVSDDDDAVPSGLAGLNAVEDGVGHLKVARDGTDCAGLAPSGDQGLGSGRVLLAGNFDVLDLFVKSVCNEKKQNIKIFFKITAA